MHLDFQRLLAIAKNQTGHHFPTSDMIRDAFTKGEAADQLCRAVTAVQGLQPGTIVRDDNSCHYLIEEVVVEACITLYEERQQRLR